MKVTISGKEYDLSFTVNAQCDLEEKTGKDLNVVLNDLQKQKKRKMEDVRLIWHCIMLDNDESMTVRQSGKLLNEYGTLNFLNVLPDIFAAAFPDPKPDKVGK